MPRYPKGVVNRQVPEWNLVNMYTQWVNGSGPGSSFQNAGSVLYNNTQGSNIVIWSVEYVLTQIAQGTTTVLPTIIEGGPGVGAPNHTITGPTTNGYCLGNPAASPLGVIYGVLGTSVPSAYPSNALGGAVGSTFQSRWIWDRSYPLVNLPPTYGFLIFALGSTNQFAAEFQVTWWYEVVMAPYQ
jgi:hypothetical protein